MRVLFVTSSGGHLAHLWALRSWWHAHDRHWICEDEASGRQRLDGETVTWLQGPFQRSGRGLVKGLAVAPRVLRATRPDVVISTGAAIAVPVFAWARLLGIPTVFIEVIDRVDSPSLTGRILGPLASRVVLHWPEQQGAYATGTVLGPLW